MADYIRTIELNDTLDWSELLYQLPAKSLFKPGDTFSLRLVYNCRTFVEAPIFPILSSYFKWLRDNNVNVKGTFAVIGDCDFHYAARIGLFEHLGIEYNYPHQARDPEGRFIPITHLEQIGYGMDPRFIKKLGSDLDLPPEMVDSVFFSVGEMIANVKQHSQIKSGAMVFGQSFPRLRETSLMVVDPGRGIHQAFLNGTKLEYNNLSEAECLEKCIEHGVTCGNGRGHGLFLISDIISRNLGTLRVISGGHYVSIVNGVKSVNTCPNWEGTIVICDFNLNNKVDFNEVLTLNGHESSEPLW